MKLGWKEYKETDLARVLSTLQVAQTDHVACDLARVGIAATAVREDGGLKTLQDIRVLFCWAQE